MLVDDCIAGVPRPNFYAGLDFIGVTIGKPTYLVRAEGFVRPYDQLHPAVWRWKQTPGAELVVVVGGDGKEAESVFDGNKWSEWQ